MKYLVKFFMILVALWAPMASATTEAELTAQVKESSERMVERFKTEKNLYRENPERFYQIMEASLEEIVDFRRIAARVMGRYAREATKEQRDQFVTVFKRSLFNAYAKTLVETGDFSVAVLSSSINARDDSRASVELEITSPSGNKYPISYSMYRNKQDGKWYIENVIVSGVNIGLAFRDRFDQEMTARRGNLDQVIANWTGHIAEETFEAESKPNGAESK